MLVRWNEIPEADRNGLVLGYKVSPGSKVTCVRIQAALSRDPWGPSLHLLKWMRRGSQRLCSGGTATKESSVGLQASKEAQVLPTHPRRPQEALLAAPASLSLWAWFLPSSRTAVKAAPRRRVQPWPTDWETWLDVPALPVLAV